MDRDHVSAIVIENKDEYVGTDCAEFTPMEIEPIHQVTGASSVGEAGSPNASAWEDGTREHNIAWIESFICILEPFISHSGVRRDDHEI